jgi:hypothetical protein
MRKNRKKKSGRLSNRARYDELKSKSFEPATLHQSALEHAKPNAASQEAARRRAAAFAERCYGPPGN